MDDFEDLTLIFRDQTYYWVKHAHEIEDQQVMRTFLEGYYNQLNEREKAFFLAMIKQFYGEDAV